MKQLLILGAFGVAVATVAFVLNNISSDAPAPEKQAAAEQSDAPKPPTTTARGSGIPVPAPPPVATIEQDRVAAGTAATSQSNASSAPMQSAATQQSEANNVRKGAPEKGSEPADAQKSAGKQQVTALTNIIVPSGRNSTPAEKGAPAKPGVMAPEFDVVRVNPAGDAVIAGRAAPGATVGIYDGDRLTGTVVADDRGDWVYLPTKPLPSGKRELSLAVRNSDGTQSRSDSVVVLMVPDRGDKPVAEAEEGANKSGALAVLMSRDGSTPSRVLQKPVEPSGVGDKKLSIDVVDYDDKGSVNIGGSGEPGTNVQVYVDDRLVGRSDIGKSGTWAVGPDQKVKPGMHKLRVDAMAQGRVVSRVEIPFARADQVVAKDDDALIVVQPGNSLWRIARRTLGEGVRYVEIFDANRLQIVDPDLIYPGQVFSLPRTN